MKLRAAFFVAACSLAFVSPVAAQSAIRISFANDRVTIVAQNATVPEILREWARVGGSTFVNADKISGAERLTLQIENEPELRAIEILLRSVEGYGIAGRAQGSTALSSVSRVVIMPGARPAVYPVAADTPSPGVESVPQRQFAGPPRPDDDGLVRQATPPPAPSNDAPAVNVPSSRTPSGAAAPIGQATPLQNTKTQPNLVFGTTTSSQPGVTIGGVPRPGRPVITPTQPKPGGGGG